MRQTSQIHAISTNFLSKSKALQYERFDSLKSQLVEGRKIALETDVRFIESVIELTRFRSSVLQEIMGLKNSILNDADCNQIHFKAHRHSQANILNIHSGMSKKDVLKQPELAILYCKCGCQRLRGEKYPITYELDKINILGSGILLYFYLIKALAIAIFLFIIIYAIFALSTNLLGTNPLTTNSLRSSCKSNYCYFRDNASDNYKTQQDYLGFVQVWLGLAAMVLWVITSRVVKYVGKIKDQEIDRDLTSASDFAIKISGLPYGEYNEEELLEYFQKLNQRQLVQKKLDSGKQMERQTSDLQLKVKSADANEGINQLNELGMMAGEIMVEKIIQDRLMGIKSVQIIYNMEFSRKMIQKILNMALKIKSMAEQKNGGYIVQDKEEYIYQKNDLIETYEVFEDLRKRFLNDSQFRKALSTRVAVVQFCQQGDKQQFLDAYGKQSVTFFKQLKEKLVDKCFGDTKTIVFKGSIPEIARAPEPSDIIWENCEKKQSTCRILFIYSLTFVLIMISFGIMVGIQYGQSIISPSATNTNVNSAAKATTTTADQTQESVSTLINIIVSIVMQVINAALWISLSFLLELEYNHTCTNKIVSQMTKTSVAMCINIILLPIIVNYFINNRYYGSDGLAGIVFDYHVSTITVGLGVKLLDPVNLLIYLGINIKFIRNNLIKARYRKEKSQDQVEEEQMRKVYKLYEAPEFNIAEAYTYILSNILHAAFFCELQPFILVLALLEAVGFYWVCKFKVLKWCKIPQMTKRLIFDVAVSQFMLVPIFYGVGSIFNSYLASTINSNRSFSFIPSAICVGIGLLGYFNPKDSIQRLIEYFVVKCSCSLTTESEELLRSNSGTQSVKKNVRLETYYKSSNSLTLLGFENVLLGKLDMGQISQELQNYCESHVHNTEVSELHNQNDSSGKQLDKYSELKEVLSKA